jgi:hypothetical protein
VALAETLGRYRDAHPARLDEAALRDIGARLAGSAAASATPPEPYEVFARLMRALPADGSWRGRLGRAWNRFRGLFGRVGAAERRAEARRARKAKRRGAGANSERMRASEADGALTDAGIHATREVVRAEGAGTGS